MAYLRVLLAIGTFSRAAEAGPIEAAEIHAVQKEWADGIVNIGAKHKSGESRDYVKALADQFVDNLYAYSMGPDAVLLKPATTPAPVVADPNASFRMTREGAISHLIGQGSTEEIGFALQPWTAVRLENVGLLLQGDVAMAMGNCILMDSASAETRVQYSFGYIRDSAGKIRINLHHASTPTPNNTGVLSNTSTPSDSSSVDEQTNAGTQAADDKIASDLKVAADKFQTGATVAANATEVAPAAEKETEKTESEAAQKVEETTTTTTTTTTTAAETVKSTTDWFFDHRGGVDHKHHILNQVGRQTKAPSELEGGSWLGLLFKIAFLVLVAVCLPIAFFMSQVKAHSKMSPAERFIVAMSMMQRKVEGMLSGKKGNNGFLPTNSHNSDKDV